MKESSNLNISSPVVCFKSLARMEFFTYSFLSRVPNIDKELGLFVNMWTHPAQRKSLVVHLMPLGARDYGLRTLS